MTKELRKQQNLLVDAGMGVSLFAIWSVVRMNLYLGLSSFSVDDIYNAAADKEINGKAFLIFMIIVFAGVLLWQLSIRLYIGLSATAEGKGKAKGCGYLVLAAILLVIDIQTAWKIFAVERIMAGEKPSLEMITAICMESASIYVLLELLISGIRVKILRKKGKE